MEKRVKIILLLVAVAIPLGFLLAFDPAGNELALRNLQWDLKQGFSDPSTAIATITNALSNSKGYGYAAMAVFAVLMMMVALKTGNRWNEEALRRKNASAAQGDAEYTQLKEENRKKTEALQAKDFAMQQLEERLGTKIYALEVQLSEKQKLLQNRGGELRYDKSAHGERWATASPTQVPAESFQLREELEQKTEQLLAKESTIKEIEEHLSGQIQALEKELSEKITALRHQGGELESLRSQVTHAEKLVEMGAANGHGKQLELQEELNKKTEALQAKDSTIKEIREIEESLREKIQALESELSEKQTLLENQGGELETLRSQMASTEPLSGMGTANGHGEQLELQEELNKKTEALHAKDSTIKTIRENEEILRETVRVLESKLSEKETLLTHREGDLEALRSQMARAEALAEMGTANEHEENLRLQEELEQKTEALYAKDSTIKKIEEALRGKVQILEALQSEKELLLQSHDEELTALRSDRDDLAARLAEMDAAKEHAERLLREELEQKTEALQAKDFTINQFKENEESLREKLQALEGELSEKQTLLTNREGELETLRSDMTRTGQLVEISVAKAQAENSLLKEELEQKEEALQAKDSTIKQTEEDLREKLQILESLRSEKELLLQSHDEELTALRSDRDDLAARLAEMGAAKENAEALLREEFSKNQEALLAKDSTIEEIEESLRGKVRDMESLQNEKELLLKSHDEELEALRSEIDDLAARLAEMGAAKENAERLLREEFGKNKETLQAKDFTINEFKENEESLRQKLQALEGELSEKQTLLTNREGELEALRSDMARTGQLVEINIAKAQAENSLLKEELEQKTEALQAKDFTINEFKENEESLRQKLQALEGEFSEKQMLLKNREKELETLRSDMTRTGKLVEIGVAKAQAENSRLKEEIKKKTDALHSKVSTIKEIEETLRGKVQTLESELSEKQTLLKNQGGELESLRSEAESLAARLAEMGSAKEHAERLLREELSKNGEALQARESTINNLEQTLREKVQALEGELSETQMLLKNSEAELESLRSDTTHTGKLVEIGVAKVQAENSLLKEELEKKIEALQAKESSINESEQILRDQVEGLESELSAKELLLKNREGELESLKSQLNDLPSKLSKAGTTNERTERLLREELRKNREALQAREMTIKKLEETLSEKVQALESELSERQTLLQTRERELESLRSQLSAIPSNPSEAGTTNERTERLLREELRKNREALQAREITIKKLEETLGGKVYALETQLSEKELLLKSRDTQLERISSELKERKALFAAEETQIWQSIGRRNLWKRRLAKLGIPMKPN